MSWTGRESPAYAQIVLGWATERSLEGLTWLVTRDRVFTLVQRGFAGALTTRKLFERNVTRLFSGANVVSRQDLERLEEHIKRLDAEMENLVDRVVALDDDP